MVCVSSLFFLTFCPCGFVEAVDEMVNSESCSTLALFLSKHYGTAGLPKFIAYDFACMFSKFVQKRPLSDNPTFFSNCTFVLDNFHARGHIKSCREKFAAKLNPALEGLNTSACEQAWIWLNDLAMNMKHMNMYNFRIYLHSAVSTHNALVESRGGIVTPLLLEGEKILIGTKVCAKFRNNFWYCGSVIKITDQRVRVLFVDQDTRVLSPHVHMRLCKHDPQLRKSPE